MIDRNKSLLEKWRNFRRRPANERRLILRAAFILPVTGIGLRLFGFRRWKELIEKFSLSESRPESLPADVQRQRAGEFVRAVRSAELHGLTTPNCLDRSMTLWWMLRSDGVEGELRIGARKQGGQFEAHAWVELDGQVLNDSAEVHVHYARFDAPIAAAVSESPNAGKADSNSTRKVASS